MQALFLVYLSKKFFIQAIKENIVSPSHFSGLCKPLACIYTDCKKNNIWTHFLNNIFKVTRVIYLNDYLKLKIESENLTNFMFCIKRKTQKINLYRTQNITKNKKIQIV